MAERIYVMRTNKIIEPLEETAFDKEASSPADLHRKLRANDIRVPPRGHPRG